MVIANSEAFMGDKFVEKNDGPVAGWQTAPGVCALSDGERHLGHVILTEGLWTAFDCTKMDAEYPEFLRLGTFVDAEEAMRAVERSVWSRRMTAGSSAIQ